MQGRGDQPVVHGNAVIVADAHRVGFGIVIAGIGFPGIGVVIGIDRSPSQRQRGRSESIEVLHIGIGVHSGIVQGGELPHGAVHSIAKGVIRHDLPVIGGAIGKIRGMIVGSFCLGCAVHHVGGRVVGSQIDVISIDCSAAVHPVKVGGDGHVGGVIGRHGVLGCQGRFTLRGRLESEDQALRREDCIGEIAVRVVGCSSRGLQPVRLGGAIVKIGVGISSQANLDGAGSGQVDGGESAIGKHHLVAIFMELNLEI
ncbi:MAG: hypothetical protein BWX75_00660 [Candidatus Cloacimonetes bacterium ADurb.Bin088]|nr:MAG: hypothetical protein BWX75_00660 [Candidatus Cloacimonetes bacterium ADurb.Bin088]